MTPHWWASITIIAVKGRDETKSNRSAGCKMIDLSQWRASIGSWNFCQRSPRFNPNCSIGSANGCRYHLFSTRGEKTEVELSKIAAFLIVFELVFLGLFLSIHILLHYSPARLRGQYTRLLLQRYLVRTHIALVESAL